MATIIVLAKAPVAGRVKTRLCPPLTHQQAAEVAEAALADTLQAVAGAGADRVVLALDGTAGPWLPAGIEVIAQTGSTFNERLHHAWAATQGPTVQIGMDTPQVTAEHLHHAFAALDRTDAALGLAVDGGWWALALRNGTAGVFDDIVMSSSDTGRQQWARLAALGLTCQHLPMLDDIDSYADALTVAAAMPGSRTAMVVTAYADALTRGLTIAGAVG